MVPYIIPSWCMDNCLPLYHERSEDYRKSKHYRCVNDYAAHGFFLHIILVYKPRLFKIDEVPSFQMLILQLH